MSPSARGLGRTGEPTMSSDFIHVSQEARVQRIVIDRPRKRNALTGDMYAEIADAFASGEADPSVRVHYITGVGDVFTAGNDMASFIDPKAGLTKVLRVIEGLRTLRKPLVVAVNGTAVGIGVTMLLHADLVYAARSATFKTPFVELGVVPEAGSSVLMPLAMGYPRAARMLLLGEVFDTALAYESGLIGQIVDDEQLAQVAFAGATTLATRPPAAVKAAKSLMRRVGRDALKEQIDVETKVFSERLASPELIEAVTAFLQKRPPVFADD